MEQTNNYSLYRQYKNKVEESKNISLTFSLNYLWLTLIGFVIGQAEIGSGFYSLSVVYWSIFINHNPVLLLLITTALGLGLLVSGDWSNLLYLTSCIFGFILYRFMDNISTNKNKVDIGVSIGLIYLVLGYIVNYFNNVLLYEYILILGESIIICILIKIVREGTKNISLKQAQFTEIEKLTLVLISSGILIGIANFNLLTGYTQNILNVLVLLVILLAVYNKGLTEGVVIASSFGVIMVVTKTMPLINIFKFLFTAFSCGIFAKKTTNNKRRIIFGLLLALFAYSGLSPSIYNFKFSVLEFIISGLIFLIIPGNFLKISAQRKQRSHLVTKSNVNKNNNIVDKQFSDLSKVFSHLSTAFEEVLRKDEEEFNKRLDDFVFLFKSNNCKKCPKYKVCWEKKKVTTYQNVKKLAEESNEEGKLKKKVINKYLKNICSFYKKLIPGIKTSFALFQLNNFWRDKLIEKQYMVAEQLAGISSIIEQFSRDTSTANNQNFSLENIENKIEEFTDIYNISFNTGKDIDRVSFKIEIDSCAGNNLCENIVKNILNAKFDYDFRLLEKHCGNKLKDEPCSLVYGPRGNYNLNVTVVQQSLSNQVSGDSYLYKSLPDGKDLVVLSDGMGVGQEAARESGIAVKLFESIIDVNFEEDVAIDTVNSALFLRQDKDNFTTLDIGFFDSFSGELNLKKIGAVSSFIKRGWDVKEIKASSLPAGILENIQVTNEKEKLHPGDFLIMLTDGVLDAKTEINNKEDWFKQILQNSSFDKPGDLAEYIMDTIIDNKKEINDDMTLLVAKVEQK
ncbi:MAG: SpoIIE family protein phosphatase [Bacillota bacterium]